jgi:hypothetical protein
VLLLHPRDRHGDQVGAGIQDGADGRLAGLPGLQSGNLFVCQADLGQGAGSDGPRRSDGAIWGNPERARLAPVPRYSKAPGGRGDSQAATLCAAGALR